MVETTSAQRSSGHVGRYVVGLVVGVAALLAGCTTATHPAASKTSRSDSRSRSAGSRSLVTQHGRVHLAGGGTIILARIPGTRSGFHARPALVYLPPAAASGARNLPVLELLHGVPGSPLDWARHGQLETTLDAFAAGHVGRAPIVVMPDINGSRRADTECVGTPAGANVEQYLVEDVPEYLFAHEPVSHDPRQWSIAGLSEGGTCAVMIALRNYPRFRAFGDLSGLARPTVGDRDDPPGTIAELFGGSVAAYRRHDPLWLLSHNRYPALSGWLACGTGDAIVSRDQAKVAAAALSAGIEVHAEAVSGGHAWPVWALELKRLLPWLWTRLT